MPETERKNAPDRDKQGHDGDGEQIIETPVRARQGFLGRPVLVILSVSLMLVIGAGLVLGYLKI